MAGSLAMRMPGVRSVMKAAGDQVAGVGAMPEPGSGISWVAAEAFDAGGARLAEVAPVRRRAVRLHRRLHRLGGAPRGRRGRRGHRRARAAAGFGLEALEEGCREAGLSRVRDPGAG